MELKACKVCKNQVADDAPTCPKCGTPLPGYAPKKDEKKELKWGTLEVIAFIAISVFSISLIVGLFDN